MRFSSTLRVLCLSLVAADASAFCGLYVARTDGELFNEASKVVMARKGRRTATTMSSDYHRDPSEFAMIVPTPGVLEREQVRTVPTEIMNAIDAYTSARLVEYEDFDPCAADPPTNDQLAVLGVNWLSTDPNAGQDVFVTRLHARYDASFAEDIAFGETDDRDNFQGRYILREPFKGAFSCAADIYQPYLNAVRARIQEEARTVSVLTGWRLGRINEEIAKTVQARYR